MNKSCSEGSFLALTVCVNVRVGVSPALTVCVDVRVCVSCSLFVGVRVCFFLYDCVNVRVCVSCSICVCQCPCVCVSCSLFVSMCVCPWERECVCFEESLCVRVRVIFPGLVSDELWLLLFCLKSLLCCNDLLGDSFSWLLDWAKLKLFVPKFLRHKNKKLTNLPLAAWSSFKGVQCRCTTGGLRFKSRWIDV